MTDKRFYQPDNQSNPTNPHSQPGVLHTSHFFPDIIPSVDDTLFRLDGNSLHKYDSHSSTSDMIPGNTDYSSGMIRDDASLSLNGENCQMRTLEAIEADIQVTQARFDYFRMINIYLVIQEMNNLMQLKTEYIQHAHSLLSENISYINKNTEILKNLLVKQQEAKKILNDLCTHNPESLVFKEDGMLDQFRTPPLVVKFCKVLKKIIYAIKYVNMDLQSYQDKNDQISQKIKSYTADVTHGSQQIQNGYSQGTSSNEKLQDPQPMQLNKSSNICSLNIQYEYWSPIPSENLIMAGEGNLPTDSFDYIKGIACRISDLRRQSTHPQTEGYYNSIILQCHQIPQLSPPDRITQLRNIVTNLRKGTDRMKAPTREEFRGYAGEIEKMLAGPWIHPVRRTQLIAKHT